MTVLYAIPRKAVPLAYFDLHRRRLDGIRDLWHLLIGLWTPCWPLSPRLGRDVGLPPPVPRPQVYTMAGHKL